ncbi:hypothetical protein CC85DRAFT_287380 [Cutaneotrichosporon oleaginosum]|uniref:Bromodomain associated domain-containing protein n=1 Tax=Cutaneotrichosporon oleaginosum TaxID=879819 RepID=A0A0J0XHJ9_9TREE|nr:uncharacterized protein CC85DRAFT_287380 [Cutaneotrichosporon oleaginosum]KLT40538.1 hypothetical protein CC85DRAFT_287380 [Cutaneotrichosporon oleaginosum]TXT08391.1 hypothetical protein COLE_05315 [Cutaneotrichosporon oleaginosum]
MSRSKDIPHTHLPPDATRHYLTRLVGIALQKRGFDGAEAGALAEMERLLEHHIQRVFAEAGAYAAHAGRAVPHARDAYECLAQQGLKRAAKRKRHPIAMPTRAESPEPVQSETLATLPEGEDVKPSLRASPEYAWDGAPGLPEPWTYKPDPVPPPGAPAGKVTTGVLDFIKLTATERGDIPPELGLVDYRRADGREVRRKWGVKGVGA